MDVKLNDQKETLKARGVGMGIDLEDPGFVKPAGSSVIISSDFLKALLN